MAQVTPFPSFPSARFDASNYTGTERVGTESRSNLTPIQSPAAVYLARLAPATRNCNRYRLDTLADLLAPGTDGATFPWHRLRYQDCIGVRVILEARYHYQTGNNYLYVLRGVLRECWKLGLMSTDDYQRAVTVEPIKGYSLPAGRYVEPKEWGAFFRVLKEDATPIGVRDLAMFGTLRATGIRKSELMGIDIEDYHPQDVTFMVLGKGNKERRVAAHEWLREPLQTWLRLRGGLPSALFCAVYKNGHVDREHKPLSSSALHLVLQQRVRQAGIPRFSLHDFRWNMATDLFDAEVHISRQSWTRADGSDPRRPCGMTGAHSSASRRQCRTSRTPSGATHDQDQDQAEAVHESALRLRPWPGR